MPIYEYCCQACGASFDARRSMKDADAPIACPTCGSEDVRRALSRFYTSTGASPSSGSASRSGGSSGCSSCSATSCSTCGVH